MRRTWVSTAVPQAHKKTAAGAAVNPGQVSLGGVWNLPAAGLAAVAEPTSAGTLARGVTGLCGE